MEGILTVSVSVVIFKAETNTVYTINFPKFPSNIPAFRA